MRSIELDSLKIYFNLLEVRFRQVEKRGKFVKFESLLNESLREPLREPLREAPLTDTLTRVRCALKCFLQFVELVRGERSARLLFLVRRTRATGGQRLAVRRAVRRTGRTARRGQFAVHHGRTVRQTGGHVLHTVRTARLHAQVDRAEHLDVLADVVQKRVAVRTFGAFSGRCFAAAVRLRGGWRID